MELIYSWIEKFRNYNEVELNYSEKFKVIYDKYNKSISITPNKSNTTIYPECIRNINAIVGKNGVGKTNLLDVLGLRTNDRNKNNSEREIRYSKKKGPYLLPNDLEAEIKHSIYFFIYFMGKDEDNQDLFCIEGNDIEIFQSILKQGKGLNSDYWKEKYWFAFCCNYSEGRLIHKYDLNRILDGNTIEEQDKLVIVSLRETHNEKYYDYKSTEAQDDYRISVPRRTAKFRSKFLSVRIRMLYNQLFKDDRLMFRNNKYLLKIKYNDLMFNGPKGEGGILNHNYKELDGVERDKCKVMESFVLSFLMSRLNNVEEDKKIKTLKKELSKIYSKSPSLEGFMEYYAKILFEISSFFFDVNETNNILEKYLALSEELSKNIKVDFQKNYMVFEITKKSNLNQILQIVNVTVDEKVSSDLNETMRVFGDFFEYSIEDLSDGEAAYLGFFASLYEQVSILTPNKENYIILLDEPETRMHPELSRNFINEMILFLKDLSMNKKKFQIIVSTHSPFILSDIQSENIIYLEKDNDGFCNPIKKVPNTFGANIHNLLKDGLFMTSTIGEFATTKIKEVILLINNDKVKELNEKQKNDCLYIINSIGEPLIRNRIMKMFNDKFLLDYTDLYNENRKLKEQLEKFEEPRKIEQTIELLKKQIEKLQIHVNELEDNKND